MEIKLKDVLHLYIGCQCKAIESERIWRLIGVLQYNAHLYCVENEDDGCTSEYAKIVPITSIKPLLTPLSDMTEEDARELCNIEHGYTPMNVYIYEEHISCYRFTDHSDDLWIKALTPDQFLFLLRKGYDLYNLIEKGESIKKSKV